MSGNYKIIDLQKGTDEWFDWRHGGIGKDEAHRVMGIGEPFPDALLQSKIRPSPERPALTEVQEEGLLLEPEARKSYEDNIGQRMPSVCIQSTIYPWMKASLDGLSDDRSKVLEITCGIKAYGTLNGSPSKYMVPQLQHILAITGLSLIDYYCYRPDKEPILKEIVRGDRYISDLIAAEERFWQKVCNQRDRSVKNQGQDDFMRQKVYVLELEGGYYYVGKCKNFPDRVKRHIEGNGSLWTKLHRPIATVAFFWGDTETEKSVTLRYMEMYGIDKVRGWVFAKGGEYQEKEIRRQIKRVADPTPLERLDRCTSLKPMKLPRSPDWVVNSRNRDAGPIMEHDSLY